MAKKEVAVGRWPMNVSIAPRSVAQYQPTFTLDPNIAGSVRFGALISSQYRLELVLSVVGSRDLVVALPVTVNEHCRGHALEAAATAQAAANGTGQAAAAAAAVPMAHAVPPGGGDPTAAAAAGGAASVPGKPQAV